MQRHPKFNRHSVLLSGRVSPGLSGTTPGRPCNANNVDILRIGLLSLPESEDSPQGGEAGGFWVCFVSVR